MRQLALVAHNHMKPAMKQFIETYSEILKKFRITGTQTTMKMCKSMWGEDDPAIHYGLTCTSGPLGGDAQIAALMCMEDLGGIIFFVDPLSAHPHQADIDSLLRLANCRNIIVCSNPASASSMMHTLRSALLEGDSARGTIPSFFETLQSPAVERYKHAQAVALANVIKGNSPSGVAVAAPAAVAQNEDEEKKAMEEGRSRRSASFNSKDLVEETPKKPVPELSDSAVDRALLGQSIIGGADLQALLLLELDKEDYSEEEEDVDVVDAAPTTAVVALAPAAAAAKDEKKAKEGGNGRSASSNFKDLVEVEDVRMNNKKAVPMRRMYNKKALPSMSDSTVDLALMGQSLMFDYSTHLGALLELEEEEALEENGSDEDDSDDEDEEEDVVAAPVPKAVKSLFGFKSSSRWMSKRGKNVRKMQRHHSEKGKAQERLANLAAQVEKDETQNLKEELLAVRRDLKKQQSLSKQREQKHKKQVDRLKRQCEQQVNGMSNDESWKSIEQRTSTLEKCQSEILVLVKEQMRLIENLTEHHNDA